MKRGVKIFLVLLILVLVLASAGALLFYQKFLADKTESAYLSIEDGTVQVDRGDGWSAAVDGMELSLNDKVKTLDGTATVVIYDSILATLQPNSEIMIASLIKESPSIKQSSGKVWNKFAKLSGVNTYEVEMPKTVATVRGTGFLTDASEDSIIVGDGEVEARSGNDRILLSKAKRMIRKNGRIVLRDINPEERALLKRFASKDVVRLKRLRKRIIGRHRDLIEKARARYRFSDKDIDKWLEQIDSGELNDRELMRKSPVKLKVMEKLVAIDDHIKKQRRLAKGYE